MDLQNPPSLSEHVPAAAAATEAVLVEETDAVPPAETPQKVEIPIDAAAKEVQEPNADEDTTPAVTTDSSDAVISSSNAPAVAREDNYAVEVVDNEVKSVDQIDKAASSEIVQSDDDLMREMEAIEGSKKVETVHISEESVPEADTEQNAGDGSASACDLLKVLENEEPVDEVAQIEAEVVETPVVAESSEASQLVTPVSEIVSTHQEASCVDSTTDQPTNSGEIVQEVPLSNSSDPSAIETDEDIAITETEVNIAESAQSTSDVAPVIEDEPMEVDEQPVATSPAVAIESVEKDEAISSTSSEEARETLDDVVELQVDTPSVDDSVVAHKEVESTVASTDEKIPEGKDEAVTSSEDTTEVSSNEANSAVNTSIPSTDSSTIPITESAPVVNVVADDLETTRPSENASNADELDQTLDTGCEPQTGRPENKLLTNMMNHGSSTPNSVPVSAAATPNVFNSTPISKQFEISSENVSKIDEHSNSTCDKTGAELASNNVSSHDDIKSSDVLTTFSGTDSTEPQSSDNLTHFANVIKKYNGLGSDSLLPISTSVVPPIIIKSDSTSKTTANLVALSNGDAIDENTTQNLHANNYEISVWYENSEMHYLSVERIPSSDDKKSISPSDSFTTSSSSDKASTTNGSVTSVGPFPLRPTRDLTVSSNSTTGSDGGKFVVPTPPDQTPLVKERVSGVVSLCNFMIEHFRKIKTDLGVEDTPPSDSAPTTPVAGRSGKGGAIKKNLSKTAAASPDATPKNKRAGKRPATSDTEEEPTPKKTKAQKKVPEPAETPSHYISVLARWTDKKYYAGHVTDSKPGNKYVVLFEDGASKTLPEEFIVFGGENSALPLLNQAVHALVGGDTYEPGLVTEINTTGETVIYTVVTESKTVSVTSSDLYLEEDQAKIIQSSVIPNDLKSPDTPSSSKRSARPTTKFGDSQTPPGKRGASAKKTPVATTPEPSTSGTGGRAGRRNKRKRTPLENIRSFSESSELSDTIDNIAAVRSPEMGLEAVDGVQPELQRTPHKGELNKIRIMSEYLGGNDRLHTMEDIIGRTQINKSLFRNKHFLLTCTIESKKSNPGVTSSSGYKDDKKSMTFTTVPFVKEHLRQQIESGGGIVYNYFEEVPKNKYKMCKIIAAHPNVTAKFVQCMAANISAISHEYIIQSCQQSKLVDSRRFQLPIGWSITENRYVRWPSGQHRSPLAKTVILVGSYSTEFTEFWSRVCRLAGADVRQIKEPSDIRSPTKGSFMVSDLDFCEASKAKADFFGIEIVSTVWVVESLILGRPCAPDASEKLRQSYQDDDY